MTEGEKAFYKQRRREELHRASSVEGLQQKALHMRRARFFEELLDGKQKSALGRMPD